MELCYEGGLVMPSSYAMMDEEEMTYVEGGGLGKHCYNQSSVVAQVIDLAIIFIPALAAMNNLCKIGKLAKLGRVYIRTNIDLALRKAKICLATTVLSCIANAILSVAGVSIGSLITYGIDMVDGASDGYCFA